MFVNISKFFANQQKKTQKLLYDQIHCKQSQRCIENPSTFKCKDLKCINTECPENHTVKMNANQHYM